jgi:hypothetical protein
LSLKQKLKIAEEKACRNEIAAREAQLEVGVQSSTIKEAQMTIYLYQQDILSWKALSEWYQIRCLQCSDFLGQVMNYLQGTPSETTYIPDQSEIQPREI